MIPNLDLHVTAHSHHQCLDFHTSQKYKKNSYGQSLKKFITLGALRDRNFSQKCIKSGIGNIVWKNQKVDVPSP